MGLDVSVYRVIGKSEFKKGDDYVSLADHPELEGFRHLAFTKVETELDVVRAFAKKDISIEEIEMTECELKGNVHVVHGTLKDGRIITVFPKVSKKPVLVVGCREVGYQRKGANTQFYEDGMWDSPCVVSSDVLHEHWRKYFSKATPESLGGWGSCVEFSLEDKERKEYFKKNIIDVFVDGEMFVQYH